MKKLFGIVICLIALSSLQVREVAAQSITKQITTISSKDANQQIQNLIMRSINEWSSEGYKVISYANFKYQNPFPSEIQDRFQQSLTRYMNKEYGNESNSFIIYKEEGYATLYILKVLEDTAGQAVPNRYTTADSYSLR